MPQSSFHPQYRGGGGRPAQQRVNTSAASVNNSDLIYNVRHHHQKSTLGSYDHGGQRAASASRSSGRQRQRPQQAFTTNQASNLSLKNRSRSSENHHALMSSSRSYASPTLASRSHSNVPRSLSRSHEERSSPAAGRRLTTLSSTTLPKNGFSQQKYNQQVQPQPQIQQQQPQPSSLSNSYPSQSRNALAASISYQVCLLFMHKKKLQVCVCLKMMSFRLLLTFLPIKSIAFHCSAQRFS